MCRHDRYQETVVNDDSAERNATAFQRTGRNAPIPGPPAATTATVTVPNRPRHSIAQATLVAMMAHFAAVSPMVRIMYETMTIEMPRSVSLALSVRTLAGAGADIAGRFLAGPCLRPMRPRRNPRGGIEGARSPHAGTVPLLVSL